MNPLEAQLVYPFADELPAPGSVREVAPGVAWLRMPLPFALDHINLWLLRDEREGRSGYTVIDCGVATDATRANWEQVLAGPMAGAPVLRVLATHCHPDHVGLSGWLCDAFPGAVLADGRRIRLCAHDGGRLAGRRRAVGDSPFRAPRFNATPPCSSRCAAAAITIRRWCPAFPDAYTRLQDNQLVAIGDVHWRVITGFGHSPEHASLYSEELNVLISGDMVLPRISTNVSVFAVEPEGNPLQHYLDSLDKFADLPEDVLVLPSHGKPFRGLHTRIDQLREHHVARLAEVQEACRAPCQRHGHRADHVPAPARRPPAQLCPGRGTRAPAQALE